MSVEVFQKNALNVLNKIGAEQQENIKKAATFMSESIAGGHLVHMFGSGHSALPALDAFPRYGSYVGFHPVLDPRLLWFNAIGPGGARELLWIERQEGYIKNFLQSYDFNSEDTFIVYSHGGMNAAPIEVALYASNLGMKVIAVTSMDNYRNSTPSHSSGKRLADVADVVIDNCTPLEDSLVSIEGQIPKVAAGSTVASVYISMSLLAETASQLSKRGINLPTFVSPNVSGMPADNNDQVYAAYTKKVKDLRV